MRPEEQVRLTVRNKDRVHPWNRSSHR